MSAETVRAYKRPVLLLAVASCQPDASRIRLETASPVGRAANADAVTMKVRCEFAPGTYEMGTATVLANGWAVTVKHVILTPCLEDPKRIKLLPLRDGKVREVGVKRAVPSDRQDLILLAPDEPTPSSVTVSTKDIPAPGTFVVSWGFPSAYGGITPLLTTAYVAGRSPAVVDGPEMMWLNSATNSGQSGAAIILPETGELVGLVKGQLNPVSFDGSIPPLLDLIADFEHAELGTMSAATTSGEVVQIPRGHVLSSSLRTIATQTQIGISSAVPARDVVALMLTAGSPSSP